MAFCDFCTCDDCTNGAKDRFQAETVDGQWICDVCFTYDCCTADDGTGKPRNPNGPCENRECEHRPRLKTGKWSEGSGESVLIPLEKMS